VEPQAANKNNIKVSKNTSENLNSIAVSSGMLQQDISFDDSLNPDFDDDYDDDNPGD
jgi:hypothetical protein